MPKIYVYFITLGQTALINKFSFYTINYFVTFFSEFTDFLNFSISQIQVTPKIPREKRLINYNNSFRLVLFNKNHSFSSNYGLFFKMFMTIF
jgi:hypothetical protein